MSAPLSRSRKGCSHALIGWLRTNDHSGRSWAIDSVGMQFGRGQVWDYSNRNPSWVEFQCAGITWTVVLGCTVKKMLDGI